MECKLLQVPPSKLDSSVPEHVYDIANACLPEAVFQDEKNKGAVELRGYNTQQRRHSPSLQRCHLLWACSKGWQWWKAKQCLWASLWTPPRGRQSTAVSASRPKCEIKTLQSQRCSLLLDKKSLFKNVTKTNFSTFFQLQLVLININVHNWVWRTAAPLGQKCEEVMFEDLANWEHSPVRGFRLFHFKGSFAALQPGGEIFALIFPSDFTQKSDFWPVHFINSPSAASVLCQHPIPQKINLFVCFFFFYLGHLSSRQLLIIF